MESRSYNFSTARKRSTQMDSKVIYFPREDDSAPRTRILIKECPDDYTTFKTCMKKFNDESKCGTQKDALTECSKSAFRKANTDVDFEY